MGYTPKVKGRQLTFTDDDDMAGLEVTVRNPNIGQLMEMDGLGAISDKPTKAELQLVFEAFAGLLVKWNVETEDGTPVPATYEGVLSQDPDFIFKIVRALQAEAAEPDPTSPPGSGNGRAAAETRLDIPMEPIAEMTGSHAN